MTARLVRSASALATLFLVACATADVSVDSDAPAPLVEGEAPGASPDVYADAAQTWEVPADLLQAIAQTETGGKMVSGQEEIEGWAPAFGVMGLRGEHLTDGARLAGLDEARVRTDRASNVMAVAALLSSWADESALDRADLGAWAPLVARYAAIPNTNATASYVWDGVFGNLQRGFVVEGGFVGGMDVVPAWPRPTVSASVLGAEHPYAVWRPSPNFNTRSAGAGGVGMVIIHDCEGAYSGCWGWLSDAASGVSAHYVISETGSEISQLVHEADRAWHVGATYDCVLNGNADCSLNGWNVNHFSVGIEHAGFSSQTSWDDHLLDVSAQLVCDITTTHQIPRDSYHIVAHATLQPYNRTDPGAGWPWVDYLDRVHAACGEATSGGTAGQIVIDSNNVANDASVARVDTSANWTSSASVSGYWNTGYWVAPTSPVSDPARFQFLAASPVCYKVDAWWTAAADRSASAPWIAYDAGGAEVGRAVVDQTARGSQWNTLGTWGFTPGWNQVDLSRWAAAGAVVVADAVRLTPATGCELCGDGVLDAGERCDDGDLVSGDGCSSTCQPELHITSVSVVTPGNPLTLTADGAAPGQAITFYTGSGRGTSPVPGCASASLPFTPRYTLGHGTADSAGHVSVRITSPSYLAYKVFKFVAVDDAACDLSPAWRQRF